ncbi:hypothetical protein GS966_19925 [Rhodococcus hoagii]|nr:hypothetical protein [Prescottella equi]
MSSGVCRSNVDGYSPWTSSNVGSYIHSVDVPQGIDDLRNDLWLSNLRTDLLEISEGDPLALLELVQNRSDLRSSLGLVKDLQKVTSLSGVRLPSD